MSAPTQQTTLTTLDNTNDLAINARVTLKSILDNTKQMIESRGQPNGLVPLDSDGKIPSTYLETTTGSLVGQVIKSNHLPAFSLSNDKFQTGSISTQKIQYTNVAEENLNTDTNGSKFPTQLAVQNYVNSQSITFKQGIFNVTDTTTPTSNLDFTSLETDHTDIFEIADIPDSTFNQQGLTTKFYGTHYADNHQHKVARLKQGGFYLIHYSAELNWFGNNTPDGTFKKVEVVLGSNLHFESKVNYYDRDNEGLDIYGNQAKLSNIGFFTNGSQGTIRNSFIPQRISIRSSQYGASISNVFRQHGFTGFFPKDTFFYFSSEGQSTLNQNGLIKDLKLRIQKI